MALPKKKMSRARRHKRRGQQKINPTLLILCGKCRKMILPHRVCQYCGTYKGRLIIDLEAKAKKKKKEAKRKKQNLRIELYG
ncbi:MAG: 50S ribosomal protein L32 [Patescibacteria group bacterium]|nr:50S ribosomal protein L32 [Patescibacteria group bacterium]